MKILALSGGGFRATLFHLGVIRYLFEEEELEDVDMICSVSGGSVLAAHLVLNWERYLEKNEEGTFPGAANEIINFVQQGMTAQIFRQWLWLRFIPLVALPVVSVCWAFAFPGAFYWLIVLAGVFFLAGVTLGWFCRPWSREELLIKQYEKFYKTAKLEDLQGQHRKRPKLYILNANLITGDLCAFSGDGFHWWGHDPDRFDRGSVSVARAVAASSAFPPVFPPVRATRKMIGDMKFPTVVLLTDGGVFDNSGVQGALRHAQQLKAMIATHSEAKPATEKQETKTPEKTKDRGKTVNLFVSIAEREFDPDERGFGSYRFLSFRSIRASDILMNRVGATQESEAKLLDENSQFVHLSEKLLQDLLPSHVQGLIRRIRTDFNSFSPAEIQLLVYYGYLAARAVIQPSQAELGIKRTEDGMPYVNPDAKVGPRWLPFIKDEEKDEVSDIDPVIALSRSGKLGWNVLVQPILLLLVIVMLFGGAPLAIRYLASPPAVPTLLAFETVFTDTTRDESEKKLLNEISRDLVLEKYMTSLPGEDAFPPSDRFFAYTKPLGEYCAGQNPNAFKCRVWCKRDKVQVRVCLFLLRDTENGPRFEIIPPPSNGSPSAEFHFSIPEAQASQKIIAIGSVDFPDGDTKQKSYPLKESILLKYAKSP